MTLELIDVLASAILCFGISMTAIVNTTLSLHQSSCIANLDTSWGYHEDKRKLGQGWLTWALRRLCYLMSKFNRANHNNAATSKWPHVSKWLKHQQHQSCQRRSPSQWSILKHQQHHSQLLPSSLMVSFISNIKHYITTGLWHHDLWHDMAFVNEPIDNDLRMMTNLNSRVVEMTSCWPRLWSTCAMNDKAKTWSTEMNGVRIESNTKPGHRCLQANRAFKFMITDLIFGATKERSCSTQAIANHYQHLLWPSYKCLQLIKVIISIGRVIEAIIITRNLYRLALDVMWYLGNGRSSMDLIQDPSDGDWNPHVDWWRGVMTCCVFKTGIVNLRDWLTNLGSLHPWHHTHGYRKY